MFENITSPNAPKAIGPYSQAVKLGDFVYLSGQLPVDPLTDELIEGEIMEQTYQVFQNIEAVLSEMNLELRHILKTTVFLSDMNDFEGMNQIYATIMSAPYPARSTVGVAALPKNAKIEIECVVIDTLKYEKAMREHHHHHGDDHECGCNHEHEHHHCEDHDCKCKDEHEHHHGEDHDCKCKDEHEHHHGEHHDCKCKDEHEHHHGEHHDCKCKDDTENIQEKQSGLTVEDCISKCCG